MHRALKTTLKLALLCSTLGTVIAAGPKPELVIQTGHASGLHLLEFSPDNRLVASTDGGGGGFGDGTVKLWEVSTGRQLRTLVGHNRPILALVFSPDGKLIASSGGDDTIRVWDVDSGRELRRFYATAQVLSFSADSRYLASLETTLAGAGLDREVGPQKCQGAASKPGLCQARDLSIWDVKDGRFLYFVSASGLGKNFAHNGWSFGFAPHRQVLASGIDGNPVILRDVSTGRVLSALPGSLAPFVFDSAGKRMAARQDSTTIALWDLTRRKRLATITDAGTAVVITNDGGRVVTSTQDAGATVTRVWDVTGKSPTLRLEIRPLHNCPTGSVYSSDGRWMATDLCSFDKRGFEERYTSLYDLSVTGQRADEPLSVWRNVGALGFSDDSRWLAGAANYKSIWFYDLRTQRQLCAGASPLSKVGAVSVSPRSKWLASATTAGIQLWDLDGGVQSGTLPGNVQRISSLFFAANGGKLLSAGQPLNLGVSWMLPVLDSKHAYLMDPLLKLLARARSIACVVPTELKSPQAAVADEHVGVWDVTTASLSRDLFIGNAPIAFSDSANIIATGVDGKFAARLWNVDGSFVADLPEPPAQGRLETSGDRINEFSFSSDGRTLATHGTRLLIWDVSTHRNTMEIDAEAGSAKPYTDPKTGRYVIPASRAVYGLAFSPVAPVLATGHEDGFLQLWDLANGGKNVCATQAGDSSWGSWLSSLAFNESGRLIAGVSGSDVAVVDVPACKRARVLSLPAEVRAVAFAGTSLLVTGSDDGVTRLWDAQSGKELASLITLNGGADWLVATPDGLFDGTPAAWRTILWRFHGKTFDVAPVEVFFREYYHPGLLAEIMRGVRPKAPHDISNLDRRQPSVGFAQSASTSKTDTSRSRAISITVTQAPADRSAGLAGTGVRDVRLFRNGSLVRVWHGVIALGKHGDATLTAVVPITAGQNLFTAYAFSAANIKSSDASMTIVGPPVLARKATAYVLAIGLNRYARGAGVQPLDFPDADVKTFAADIKGSFETLGRYSRVEVTKLLNEGATKKKVLGALRRLAQKAQPEDTVIVFFSGHGVKWQGDPHYYLYAHDSIVRNGQLSGFISDEDLGTAFEKLDVGELVLVIDACQSGQTLVSDDARQGPMNNKGLAQLAYDKGMYILVGSDASESSIESANLAHGILTYTLMVEGLERGKAFGAQQTQISVRNWLEYAVHNVPPLQRREALAWGRKTLPSEDEATLAQLIEKRGFTQHPRAFYRRDAAPGELAIAKP